jgi:hypothetical protein
MAVVDADGLVEADEASAACEARGELPVLGNVRVGEAAGVADGGGAQHG